jgi:hypothetical protein
MTSVVQNKLLLKSFFILLSYQLYLSDNTTGVKLLLQALITNEPGSFLKTVPLLISATIIIFVSNRNGQLILL